MIRRERALVRFADSRPVPVLQDDLHVLNAVPPERARVPYAKPVIAVEWTTPIFRFLDSGLREQLLVAGADWQGDVPLRRERLPVLDHPGTEVERADIAVP